MALARRIIRPGPLAVDRADVMRLLGYKAGRTQVTERHLALVDQGIALAQRVADPVAAVAYCAAIIAGDEVKTALPGVAWRSRSLAKLLRPAVGLHLVAATLGPGIEEQTQALFQAEEFALATIVDAAGSAMIHALSLALRAELSGAGDCTPLYGPGYGDWPISDQAGLTQAAGGEGIGLTCSATSYLTPMKSLVGVIGQLAPQGERRRAASGCALCTMADCAYRLHPGRGGSAR